MRLLPVLVIAVSPLVIHGLISLDRPSWALYWVGGLLLAWGVWTGLLTDGSRVLALLLSVCGSGVLLLPALQGQQLMQLLPVSGYLGLALLFGSSLLPGRVALITRLAALMRGGNMPEPVASYTRGVTLLWTLFFVALALVSLALALWGSLSSWSLFVNFIAYLLIGGLMLAEFTFRRWYLGELVDYDLGQFIGGLMRVDYASLFRGR